MTSREKASGEQGFGQAGCRRRKFGAWLEGAGGGEKFRVEGSERRRGGAGLPGGDLTLGWRRRE